MRALSLSALFLALSACWPAPPPRYTLPPPASMPSESLLPEEDSGVLKAGACTPKDVVTLSPTLAAGIGAELDRLEGRALALQKVERDQAEVLLSSANTDLEAQYGKLVAWRKYGPPVIGGALVLGALLGAIFVLEVAP